MVNRWVRVRQANQSLPHKGSVLQHLPLGALRRTETTWLMSGNTHVKYRTTKVRLHS